MSMPVPKPEIYTIQHIYDLPEGQRAELIDGQIYNMAPPAFTRSLFPDFIIKSVILLIQQKAPAGFILPLLLCF